MYKNASHRGHCATLNLWGDPKSWNGGMAEWRNGGMVEWWNGGMVEWWNGGMAEWRNGGMAEWRKKTPNPKARNGGK